RRTSTRFNSCAPTKSSLQTAERPQDLWPRMRPQRSTSSMALLRSKTTARARVERRGRSNAVRSRNVTYAPSHEFPTEMRPGATFDHDGLKGQVSEGATK